MTLKCDETIKRIVNLCASEKAIDIVAYTSIILVFFAYLLLLDYSYSHFFTFNQFDKGIMYQLMHNTAVHGEFFYSSINGGLIDFAIHQRYILILFTPLFYLFPYPITFSVISSSLLAIGALPVYWLASKVTTSKKIGLLFIGLYFFYPSVSWFFLESVKEEIFAFPFLIFAFYYLYQKNYGPFMLALILAALCKQNIPLIVIMFGIYAYLENYDRKWIISPIIIGSTISILEIFFLKPFFISLSSDIYGFQTSGSTAFQSLTLGRYSHLGSSISDIILNIVTDPTVLVNTVCTAENLAYLLLLLLPVGFISILKPKVLLIGLPALLQNILSSSIAQKMIIWHYASVPAFVVMVSAILAFPVLSAKLDDKHKKMLVIILITASVFSFYAYGPVSYTMNHIHNVDYSENELGIQFDTLHAAIDEIPNDASIMATQYFGPYIYNHINVSYPDYSGKSFHESYDYYLLQVDTLKEYSLFEVFEKIIQRPDMHLKYYDERHIVLGTGESTTEINKGDVVKLVLFKTQPGVGCTYYDTAIGENVFYSPRHTNTGYLVYGPYMHLPAGNYTIQYMIKAESITSLDGKIATIDIFSTYIDGSTPSHVVDARKDIYRGDLIEGDFTPISLDVSVDNYNSNRRIEFRVFQPQNSDLYVKEINILKT